jgi:protein-S-isoprenylcysteine O-methyltransferase Ste14
MTEDRSKPFSTGGFFLVQLAMFIPILNIILLLVFALSGSTNMNLQNWSRAMLIFVAIGLLVSIVGAVLGVTVIGGVLESIRGLLENVDVQNGLTIPK